MSKNKAARRAQKKHQKEKKRQARRAEVASREVSRDRDIYMGWRAEHEPVRALLQRGMGPGLAERYAAQYQAEFARSGRLLNRKLWLRDEIDELPESEVLEKLKSFDIAIDRDAFRALAAKYRSAWALAAEEWIARTTRKLTLSDEDFLCAAARVQWSRWIPERPSREALDERLATGYDAFHEGDFRAGVERWFEFWGELRRALPEGARRYEDADDIVGEPGFIRSWLTHLIERLTERDSVDLELGSRLEQLMGEFLEVFSAEPAEERVAVEYERGGLQWVLARDAEAESLFRRLLAEHPARPEGYVGLARLLEERPESEGGGSSAALELLEQAKSRCSTEVARAYGVEIELNRLKQHRREA